MLDSIENQRRVGRFAWVMAWVGLVAGQLHALARFRTADGRGDLELPLTAAWAEPAADLFGPLLDWGDPDLVYVTYGKVWLPVFLAFTLCAAVVYRRRRPGGFEKWTWRVTLTSYSLACLAVFLDYWTQWAGEYNVLFDVAWLVTIPALLMTMVSTTVLGGTLLVKRGRPVLPATLLVLVIPLAMLVLQVTSMGNAALPIMFAFAILGRRIARTEPTTESRPAQAAPTAIR